MNLQKRNENLPATIEELATFVLIGRDKLSIVRSQIKAIDKLGLAKDVREQKKDEAQMLAGALLDAEVKIGELFSKLPKDNPNKRINSAVISSKAEATKKLGFSPIQVSRFQQLSEHPEIVEQVKAEAKENDDLPTRTEVLNRIRVEEKIKRDASLTKIELPIGTYNVIYADPAWEYRNAGISGSAENHYPTMSTDEICALKIPSAKNSVLFLWVTNPLLEDAFKVISSWGFEYKTNMVWIKDKAGQGFYVKGQHELLLICVKGNFTPDNSLYIRSVVESPREKHSRKPEIFYDIIEKLYPEEKYLELFARQKRNDNWTAWGNQIKNE